jgi:hypothetical protein
MALLVVGTLTPASALTRAELTARAKQLMFEVSLGSFLSAYRDGAPNDANNPLDWSADGCSVPDGTPYKSFFRDACLRHDFGYRNLGNGVFMSPSLALDSTESAKKAVDAQLLEDQYRLCATRSSVPATCRSVADQYVTFLGIAGSKSWTAFYDHECTPGYFCLFDDTGYADRRKRFTVSHDDMNDYSFGDKASSVKNRTSDAWVIYDDHGWEDRHYCIAAGGEVSSLGSKWDFNDKTSSIKRLSTSYCP